MDESIISRKALVRILIDGTGLSPDELGERIGASDKSIYKWIKGDSLPSGNHLLSIISILGTDQSAASRKALAHLIEAQGSSLK